MLAIMGTSTCHMLIGETEKRVPGMCGVVADGILPGYYGYEAGQSCVGDHFAWFMKNCVPPKYFEEAEAKNTNIYEIFREKCAALAPGESGLVAVSYTHLDVYKRQPISGFKASVSTVPGPPPRTSTPATA